MRSLLSFLLVSLFAFSGKAKPNFVVVLVDDHAFEAISAYETYLQDFAKTPAIDQLASESSMMTRFYCSVSQCAPLRAELYTGLLPKNNGVLANAVKEKRTGVRNVADHLIPLGYEVGLTGKRHFGLGSAKIDVIPGFSPNGNGSNQVHSFDGFENYVSQAKQKGN